MPNFTNGTKISGAQNVWQNVAGFGTTANTIGLERSRHRLAEPAGGHPWPVCIHPDHGGGRAPGDADAVTDADAHT